MLALKRSSSIAASNSTLISKATWNPVEISLRSPRNRNAFQTFRPFSQSIRSQSRPVDIDSGNGTRAVDARVVGLVNTSQLPNCKPLLRSSLISLPSIRRSLPFCSTIPSISISSTSASSIRTFTSSSHLRFSPSINQQSSTSTSNRQRPPFEFLVGYAFAGKPRGGREDKESDSQDPESNSKDKGGPKEIGFPPDSDVGRWRDSLLGGGEAGEDALMCAGMGLQTEFTSKSQENEDGPILEGGDVVLGVADGVGGWVESGVDPSLFSQALMYHATRKAANHYACPDRVEDLATEGVSSTSSSAPSSPSSSSSSNSSSSSTSNSSTDATSISDSSHPGSPISLLQYAYDKVLEEKLVEAGSATACIVTLDSTKGVLRSANLGDSGFLILRQGSGINSHAQALPKEQVGGVQREDKDTPVGPGGTLPSAATRTLARGRRPSEGVLFASAPLQLGFNCPLQLAKLPKHLAQEGSISNVPDDSALWECRLRDGDIVLLGTDGLFDNVHQSEIVQLTRFIREKHHSAWIAKHGKPGSSKTSSDSSSNPTTLISSTPDKSSTPTLDSDGLIMDELAEERAFIEVLAHNLVEYTRMCQFSQTKKSPFEREAEKYGIRYPGGKVDDVAVCLALVKER